MSSLDADVNINLIANDNASQPIDNSVKNIDRSFVQMRNSVRANERSFYLQHQSLFKFNQAMGTMRQVTGAGIGIMNTLLLSQIRNAAAAKNLRDAQRDVNEAFIEFGPGSREHIDALQTKSDLLEEIAANVKQEQLQWATIGLHLTSVIIPAIIKMKGLLTPIAAATAITSAAGAAGVAGTAGAAGGGLLSKTLKGALRFGAKVTPPLVAMSILSDIQQAGGGDDETLPEGIDAIKPFMNWVNNIYINISGSDMSGY